MLPLKQFSVSYRALPVVLCFVCESHFTLPFLKMHSWSVLWLGEVSLGTFGTPHMEKNLQEMPSFISEVAPFKASVWCLLKQSVVK